jgi:hypothetical protein
LLELAAEGAMIFDGVSWKETVAVLGVLLGLFTLLNGLFLWAFKWLLDRHHERFSERFAETDERLITVREELRELEREVFAMRTELPQKYVSREDWIRFSATLDAKLDGIREDIKGRGPAL